MIKASLESVLGRRALGKSFVVSEDRYVDGVGFPAVVEVYSNGYVNLCWAGAAASALLTMNAPSSVSAGSAAAVAERVLKSKCGKSEGWFEGMSIDFMLQDFSCALLALGLKVGLRGKPLKSPDDLVASVGAGVVFSRVVKSIGHIVFVHYTCRDTCAPSGADRVISVFDSQRSWTSANRVPDEFMTQVYSASA